MAARSVVRRARRAAKSVLLRSVLIASAAALYPASAWASGGTVLASGTIYAAPSASGTTCTSADPCSLAEALAEAGSSGGSVELLAGAYVIRSPLMLDAGAPVTLFGSPSGSTLIGSAMAAPMLEISGSAPVTLRSLELSQAFAGAIRASGGPLTVEGSTFAGDRTYSRRASAGGIDFSPSSSTSELELEGDTFYGNSSQRGAGAVLARAAPAAIEGSTFVEDSSLGGPGAIGGSGPVGLQADLFVRDGAGACRRGATLASGVIVVASTCDGAPSASAASLFPRGVPQLAANGGPVPTVALAVSASDPALQSVGASQPSIVQPGAAFCSLVDAREVARLVAGASSCASGALQPDPPAVASIVPASGGSGTAVTLQGRGFGLVSSVTIETVAVAFQASGDDSLTFDVPVGLYNAKAPVVVSSPDGEATTSFVVDQAFAVATTSLPPTEVGATYSAVVSANGGVGGNHWSATGLPPGVALAANGLLYGRPAAPGTASVVVSVSDNADERASATLSIDVAAGPKVTTAALPPVHAGSTYAVALHAGGGTPPYRWSVPAKSPLPGGLLLSSGGVLTGRPTRAGTRTIVVQVTDAAGGSSLASLSLKVTPPPPPLERYGLISAGGKVASFGSTRLARRFSEPVGRLVGIAADPAGKGYWLLTSSGRVIGVGGALTLGSLSPAQAAGTPVGVAAEPGGGGYWVADADGAVFAFGSAPTELAGGASALRGRVVAIAADPHGAGYWLLEASGRVDAFGAATSYGWVAKRLHAHAVGIAPVVSGEGYYVLTAGGRVYGFGNGRALGAETKHRAGHYVGIAGSPVGIGYWLATSGGMVVAVGSARDLGARGPSPMRSAVAIAAAR